MKLQDTRSHLRRIPRANRTPLSSQPGIQKLTRQLSARATGRRYFCKAAAHKAEGKVGKVGRICKVDKVDAARPVEDVVWHAFLGSGSGSASGFSFSISKVDLQMQLQIAEAFR